MPIVRPALASFAVVSWSLLVLFSCAPRESLLAGSSARPYGRRSPVVDWYRPGVAPAVLWVSRGQLRMGSYRNCY